MFNSDSLEKFKRNNFSVKKFFQKDFKPKRIYEGKNMEMMMFEDQLCSLSPLIMTLLDK